MLIHLFFNTMQSWSTNHETMEGRTHILTQEILQLSRFYFLIRIPNSGQSKAFCIFAIALFFIILQSLKQLITAFLDCHESWRFINFFVLQYILLSPFFYFNIHQHQCVKISFYILVDFWIETIRLPFLCPKGNRYNLSKSVNLKASTTYSTHDTRVMNDLDLDAQFDCPQIQIRMRCGTEGITNYKERIVKFLIICYFLQNIVYLNFAKIPISLYDGNLQILLQFLIGCAHN